MRSKLSRVYAFDAYRLIKAQTGQSTVYLGITLRAKVWGRVLEAIDPDPSSSSMVTADKDKRLLVSRHLRSRIREACFEK
jgi:hypothetical protein